MSAADDLRQRKAELERRLERCGAVPGRDRAGSWQVSARLPSDLVLEWLALEAELAAERECRPGCRQGDRCRSRGAGSGPRRAGRRDR